MAINPLIRTAFAEVIEDHRRGVSQKAVAKAWKISAKAVSDYVNEIANAGPKNFNKLAANMAQVPPETFARMVIDKLHEVSRRELTVNDKGEVEVKRTSTDDRLSYIQAPPPPQEVGESASDHAPWDAEETHLGAASRNLADAFAHFVETLATDVATRTVTRQDEADKR